MSHELPGHPTNLLLVRVRESARDELLPSYLYYVFVHLFLSGYFRSVQTGSVQQCIRAQDVKDIRLAPQAPKSRRRRRMPDPIRLGRLVEVRSGVTVDKLREGDILLQRVGTCGRPSLVLGTDPLQIRTERSGNPEPSGNDWNYYINFVLYAVVGLTGQADSLMREHGDGIRRAAEVMRSGSRLKLPKLYRGILLEPDLVTKGKCKREMDGDLPVRTFESYSESKDVACWFAHPESIMSSFVRQQRPSVEGYVATRAAGQQERLLWHHTWDAVPLPGRVLPLLAAAQAHPEIDPGQFHWNRLSQREAVLEPAATRSIKVQGIASTDCPDVDELDATYTYPPFLAQYTRE